MRKALLVAGVVALLAARTTSAAPLDPRWKVASPPGIANISRIQFDPADARIAYVPTANGLFRSEDRGYSWSVPQGAEASADDVAVAPANPAIVYATTTAGLFRSADRGLTFVKVNAVTGRLAVDPLDANIVYVADGSLGTFETRIVRSIDGGQTFAAPVSTAQIEGVMIQVLVDPSNGKTLYVVKQKGILKSTDSGASWTLLPPVSTLTISFMAFDPQNPGAFYVAALDGIFASVGGGQSWEKRLAGYFLRVAASGPRVIATTGGGLQVSDGGGPWVPVVAPRADFGLALAPSDWKTLLVVGAQKLYRSTTEPIVVLPAGVGLSGGAPTRLALDANDAGQVYTVIASTLYASRNFGETWEALAPAGSAGVNDAATDGVTSSIVYAIVSQRLYRSVDGGTTFADFDAGRTLPPSILRVYAHPAIAGTAYALASNALYRRRAEEVVWTKVPTDGLPLVDFPSALVFDDSNPAVLYLTSASKVFRSVNSGATWTALALPQLATLYDLAVDPQNGNHLAMTSQDQVHESYDAGATWSSTGSLGHFAVAFDPANAGWLFGSQRTNTAPLLVRLPGSQQWREIYSTDGRFNVNRLLFSKDGNTLYAWGSGIWKLRRGRARAISH